MTSSLLTHKISRATSPLQVLRTSGNITAGVAGAWTDLDDGGTAAARPLDVVLPNMAIGDPFDYRPIFSAATVTGAWLGTLAVIVGGAVQRNIFDATFGFLPWSIPSAQGKDIIALTPRLTVVAGDLENGSLRLRFRYIQATNARTINAVAGIPLIMEGRGPLD